MSSKLLDLLKMREMLSEDAHAKASQLLHETFKIFTSSRPEGSTITIDCTCGERKIKIAVSDDYKKALSEETSRRFAALHPNMKVGRKLVVIDIPTN